MCRIVSVENPATLYADFICVRIGPLVSRIVDLRDPVLLICIAKCSAIRIHFAPLAALSLFAFYLVYALAFYLVYAEWLSENFLVGIRETLFFYLRNCISLIHTFI